jgi:hypothetical protein
VFGGIWHHIHGRRWAGNVSRRAHGRRDDPQAPEDVEDLKTELFVEEHLGGIHAERLIDTGKPPRD